MVSLGLAIFVYIKNPSIRVNRLSSALLFSFAVLAIGQSALGMSSDESAALPWAGAKLLGLILFAPLFLHTILVSTNKESPFGRIEYLYIPSAFFALALPVGLLVSGTRHWWHGYDVELKPMGIAVLAVLIAYTAYAAYVLAKKYSSGTEPEKLRMVPLLAGSLFLLVGFAVEAIRLVGTWAGIESGDIYPFLTPFGILMSVLFSYSAVKYSVLEVKPLSLLTKVEVVGPPVQAGMLVLCRDVDKSRGAFLGLVSQGCSGLIVTKHRPEKVRNEIGLENIPVIWLDVGKGRDALNPRKLESLFLSLQEFVGKSGEVAILIDDLNYLLSMNSLAAVRSFLVNSVELISGKRARMIVCLDEKKMNPDVLAELEQLVNYQYLMSIFYCLSSPIRKSILFYLKAGRASFTEIYKASGLMFPSKLSFHLNCLRDCGLLDQDEEKKYALTWKGEAALEMLQDFGGTLVEKFKVE